MELYQILILVFAALVIVLYAVSKFCGVDILQKIVLTKPVISALVAAVGALSELWDNPTLKVVHVAMRAGAEAAQFAEKAWLMGEIEKEKRNEYAKGLARAVLMRAGINVTDQIEMIISGIIEAVCVLLPHGVEPKIDNE